MPLWLMPGEGFYPNIFQRNFLLYKKELHRAVLFAFLHQFYLYRVEESARFHILGAEIFAAFTAFFAHYAHLGGFVFGKEIAALAAVAFYLFLFAKVAENEKYHIAYVLVVVEAVILRKAAVLRVYCGKLSVVYLLRKALVAFLRSLQHGTLGAEKASGHAGQIAGKLKKLASHNKLL